jgi:hypothetical protein
MRRKLGQANVPPFDRGDNIGAAYQRSATGGHDKRGPHRGRRREALEARESLEPSIATAS